MFSIGSASGKYHDSSAGKELSDALFDIYNDARNIDAIKQIFPNLAKAKGNIGQANAMFMKYLDKDQFVADSGLAETAYAAIEKSRSNFDPNNMAAAVADAFSNKSLEAEVKQGGGNAAWERFRTMAKDIADAVDKASDSTLKQHITPKLEKLKGPTP